MKSFWFRFIGWPLLAMLIVLQQTNSHFIYAAVIYYWCKALRVACAVCSPIPSFIISIWENRLITILIKIDCYVCWLLSDSVWSFESWSFAYFNVILISLSRRSICWNWHSYCHCYCHCQCHWARSFHGIRIIHLIIVMVHLCIKQSSNYVIWLNNAWNCSIQSSKVWFNVIECMAFLWQILPI